MDMVLIPAYEPDKELIKLTEALTAEGLSVLVVDDGSGAAYADIFAAIRRYVTVVTLPENCGKGAALKTGMQYILDAVPACEHVITCDADGQHTVADVLRVQECLHNGNSFVLTTRLRRKGIPLRSRVGNALSRFVYAMLTGRYLSDNQSGLRGFSREHLAWLVKVGNNNYDYEMNVLYYAAKMGVRIVTLNIEAIYIGNNESSHFSPVMDTVRIYRSLFALARGTFLSFLFSELAALAISLLWGYEYLHFTIPSVGALAFMINTVLTVKVFLKPLTRYDFLPSLGFTILSYFVYMLMCMVMQFQIPHLPLFAAFNIAYAIGIPLRYALYKFTATFTKR